MKKIGVFTIILSLMLMLGRGVFDNEIEITEHYGSTVPFDFSVSGTVGKDTSSKIKTVTNGPYRVYFQNSDAPNQIRLNTVMHDMSHNVRGQGKVLQYTDALIGSNGEAGNFYHGNLWREYEWDPAVEVWGTFSPDA